MVKQYVVFLDHSTQKTLEVNLDKENGQAEILGIVIGTKRDVIRLSTIQHHQKKNTKSNLLIRGLLFDEAVFSFSGLIRIDKEASLSDAYQKNESLVFSPHAKTESKPYLEILAKDVRCTHGATIGTVNDEEIFYLESRGFSKKKAVKLIVEGFATEVIDKIKDKVIKEKLRKRIMRLC